MPKLKFGGISGEQLRQYIERIERLEQEKQDVSDNIRDAFAEAKGNGFDVKVMRRLLKLRKMKPEEREEQDNILELYKRALGMTPLERHIAEQEEADAGKTHVELHDGDGKVMFSGSDKQFKHAAKQVTESLHRSMKPRRKRKGA